MLASLTVACSKAETPQTSEVTVAASASNGGGASAPPASAQAAPVGSSAGAGAPCDSICRRTAELRCGAAAKECLSGCLEMAGAPVCREEMLAALKCMDQQPVSHWECDGPMASLRSGFCDPEQERVASCVTKNN